MMMMMMMMQRAKDFIYEEPDETLYPIILPNIIFLFMLLFTIIFFSLVTGVILYCLFRPGVDEDERLNLMLKQPGQPIGQTSPFH